MTTRKKHLKWWVYHVDLLLLFDELRHCKSVPTYNFQQVSSLERIAATLKLYIRSMLRWNYKKSYNWLLPKTLCRSQRRKSPTMTDPHRFGSAQPSDRKFQGPPPQHRVRTQNIPRAIHSNIKQKGNRVRRILPFCKTYKNLLGPQSMREGNADATALAHGEHQKNLFPPGELRVED